MKLPYLRFGFCLGVGLLSISSCRHASTISSNILAVNNCASDISDQSCKYYDCLETNRKCGNTGYPLAYGKRYCNTFQGMCSNTLSSAKALSWVRGTTKCLQSFLTVKAIDITTCGQLETTAFDSHPYCYTNGAVDKGGVSFCSLLPSEWNRIRACVSFSDRLSANGFKQIAATAKKCLGFFSSIFSLTEKEAAERALETADPQTQKEIDEMTPEEKIERIQALEQLISDADAAVKAAPDVQ